MTTIITRLYASSDKAAAAVSALKAKNFRNADVDCVAGDDAGGALRAAGVYEAAAQTYAEKLKEGGAVVVVRAPYGNTILARRILDAAGPEASPVKHDEVFIGSVDKPSCSDSRYLPELLPEGTLVMSDMLFPRAVIKGDWTLTGSFGLLSNREPKVSLSDNATPFSSALGLPLLSKREPRVRIIETPPRATLIEK
jgi:hypothetical protein